MATTIAHADMDAFYASVEQRDNPEIRGRPVVVGGKPPRGVVAAASYEARSFGIYSAIPTAHAIRRCPELIVIAPRIDYYAQISARIHDILHQFSPVIEPLSLDEAFVDLTGTERLHGAPIDVARAIKKQVRDELDLVVSVGLGPSKFIAKIASALSKPDGLLAVKENEVAAFLAPLPVRRLWGVGQVSEKQLHALGIETIGDLAQQPEEMLRARFGKHGQHLWQLARGLDNRPVVVDYAAKSIGQEDTFETDIDDIQRLSQIVREQADHVAARLRAHNQMAQTVVLKLKTAAFQTKTRRRKLTRPTDDGAALGQVATTLLAQLQPKLGPLRLTGLSVTGLVDAQPVQLSFDQPAQPETANLGRTLDEISNKFGGRAIARGRLPKDNLRAHRQRKKL